jgi:hypothetical protein
MTDRMRDILGELGSAGLRVAWAIAALAIALGSAGLVGSLEGLPGTASRPELTWTADRAIEPGLDAAVDELQATAGRLDRLFEVGRDAFIALVDRDTDRLSTLIARGTDLTRMIDGAATELQADLRRLPGTGLGEELRLSGEVLARRDAIAAAAELTGGLEIAWARVERGGLDGIALIGLLEDHDAAVAAASADGRRRRYQAALRDLDRADALMADADRLMGRLQNTTDVDTLREWLSRSATYDRALRRLYAALRDSAGRVTDEVRDAFAEEQTARDLLPTTTNPLEIIMNDVAQAGVNDALIAIDLTRQGLGEALAELEPAVSGPSPGGAP